VRRRSQPGDNIQHGGLAASGFPGDRGYLALFQVQIDTLQDLLGFAGYFVDFVYAFQFEHEARPILKLCGIV